MKGETIVLMAFDKDDATGEDWLQIAQIKGAGATDCVIEQKIIRLSMKEQLRLLEMLAARSSP